MCRRREAGGRGSWRDEAEKVRLEMLWSCDGLGGRWSWGTGEALTFMQGPVSRRGLHNSGSCARDAILFMRRRRHASPASRTVCELDKTATSRSSHTSSAHHVRQIRIHEGAEGGALSAVPDRRDQQCDEVCASWTPTSAGGSTSMLAPAAIGR